MEAVVSDVVAPEDLLVSLLPRPISSFDTFNHIKQVYEALMETGGLD